MGKKIKVQKLCIRAIGAVAIAAGVATGGLGGLIVTASLSFVGGGVGDAVN